MGSNEVYAYLDREDRRERVNVELKESSRFELVQQLQKPRGMQPREAVKLLRLDLHGGNVGHVIQALSRIDFTRTSAGKTDVAHGRESLGRSVEAVVQQADTVPERFTLAVQPWTTAGFSRYGMQVEFRDPPRRRRPARGAARARRRGRARAQPGAHRRGSP